MARIKDGLLKGKIGKVVYSEWKGIEVVKSAPQRSKNSWSERQIMHRERFKIISEYCRKYKFTLIPQIWNLAAENGHGSNLFRKANTPAFALDGQLTAIEKLHFSAGRLPFPQQMNVKRIESEPSKLEASWENDKNLSPVYSHDELMIVAGYPDHYSSPIATGVLRKTGKAVIDLPENVTDVWIFFRTNKKDAYSWDHYFEVKV